MRLADYDLISFDCYGTLIDWERGIWTALAPLAARAPTAPDRETALAAFAAAETAQQQATPRMPYAEVLAAVHASLARHWNAAAAEDDHRRFAASIGDWPAFPDTVDALRALGRHARLVILSNVDRASFAATLPRLGVRFAAVLTAEDIGSYKPDPRNFAYLLGYAAALGVPRARLLHVAQSLYHDHAPANAAGITSAWIDRRAAATGWGATAAPPADVRYDLRCASLGELAGLAG